MTRATPRRSSPLRTALSTLPRREAATASSRPPACRPSDLLVSAGKSGAARRAPDCSSGRPSRALNHSLLLKQSVITLLVGNTNPPVGGQDTMGLGVGILLIDR